MRIPERSIRHRSRGGVPALPLVFGALGLVLGAALPASAQAPAVGAPTAYERERLAFEAADTDGDGRISEAELARDAAAAFSGLDANRDRKLTREELGEHDPRLFDRVDANRDGVLTFQEVMRYKIRAFEAADTNKDGALSFEEMMSGAAKELEGLR